MRNIILILSTLFLSTTIFSQKVTVEGYAFEDGNRGFLNEVKIIVLEKKSRAVRGETHSNIEGFFTLELAPETDYIIQASKKVFKNKEVDFTTKGTEAGKKAFTKVELERKPGYLFDVTMSEKRGEKEVVDAIQGARIEVYNNTKKKESLVLEDYEHPNFNVTFEQGNHYTIMIRKKDFFTKRMEAYVNVAGCILCFDGVGDVRPGVSDVMTKNNTMGTLLANVELDRAELNESIKVENIYYDLAKWDIRNDASEELDKLLVTLKDNPSIIVELGSHTDCRGRDSYNMDLSQKRAESAVAYLVERGIDASRIKAKGYGETVLVNECANGVRCSERRHQLNRRTELKILGFLENDPYSKLSLQEIIEEETMMKLLEEVQNQEIIQVREGDELPEEIKNANKKSNQNQNNNIEKETPNPTPDVKEKMEEKMEEVVEVVNVNKEESVVVNSKPSTTINTKVKKTTPVKASAQKENENTETVLTNANTNTSTSSSGKILTGSDIEDLIQKEKKIVVEESVGDKSLRVLKSVASDFTGYKVEILNSNSKLPPSHVIFTQHGNLTLEETKEGTFAYLLGDFKEKKDAVQFLEFIVAPRYPEGRVVSYFKGRRVKL